MRIIAQKRLILRNIKISPISDEKTYQETCDLIDRLLFLGEFKDEKEENIRIAYLDALATLVEAYETKHFEFNQKERTLNEVIEQALEQMGLHKKDLANMLGSNRVSEIFSGKQDMSLAQIKILNQRLHIPTEILIYCKRQVV